MGGIRALDVKVTVDVSRMSFTLDNGTYRSSIDLAVFCNGQAPATYWHTVDLVVPAADFPRAKTDGFTFTVRSMVDLIPRRVLVVVYDPGADLVAAAYARER